ncbi:MAG: sulfotransferase domain-containing protein [Cyclobacteriaceae bacterium]
MNLLGKLFRGKKRIFIFTVHKAASMFLHKIASDLSDRAGLKHYSINNKKNSRYWFDFENQELQNTDLWRGKHGCFGPIRRLGEIPDLDNSEVILHLRDPRDVLVSQYYSYVYSHPVIEGVFELTNKDRESLEQEGIDEFVLKRADKLERNYRNYLERFRNNDKCRIVKYEEMVIDFSAWLDPFCQVFDLGEKDKVELVKTYEAEFTIEKEDAMNHKRNITPGDHKQKLKKGTIIHLNTVFTKLLDALEYS